MDLKKRQEEQGVRLRSERKRIGLRQEDFAKKCGVSKRTQVYYEKGVRSPNQDYWFAASDLGVDITYIFDGDRVHIEGPEVKGHISNSEMLRVNTSTVELVCMINKVMAGSGLNVSDYSLFNKMLTACVELEQSKPFLEMNENERSEMERALIAVSKVL